MTSKTWIVSRRFDGEPQLDDFDIVEEELPELSEGEILLEAVWWSVDPFVRLVAHKLPLRRFIPGHQISRVVKSRNRSYPMGTYFLAAVGWKTHHICNPDTAPPVEYAGCVGRRLIELPVHDQFSESMALGALGMSGLSAYFGLLDICSPKGGETLLVNCAAGSVGSLVGQLAKLKGCIVIGSTGNDEKVHYLKEQLKFDHAFNYRKTNLSTFLEANAITGIDCFFDNVGGYSSCDVIANHMNIRGRVAVCGAISRYQDGQAHLAKGTELSLTILLKQIRVEGFIYLKWEPRFGEALDDIRAWIAQGKLVCPQHVLHGFQAIPRAFCGMLKGENVGKTVVQA